MPEPRISQRAVDAIISFEVSSRRYYERTIKHPEWPGGRSGVTDAIGYDLGYSTPEQIRADWQGRVPDEMVAAMTMCAGVRGDPAHALAIRMRGRISVPWDAATAVFLERDVPKWTSAVIRVIPRAAEMPPDCLGAVVSIAFNRGCSFDEPGDRYREMRAIKDHIQTRQWSLVPGDIRAMKRLWPSNTGLPGRREAEAKLFEAGMNTASVTPPPSHAAPESPARQIAPPRAGAPEAVAATSTFGGLAWLTTTFQHSHVLELIGAAAGVAVGAWFATRAVRSGETVANQKDRPA